MIDRPRQGDRVVAVVLDDDPDHLETAGRADDGVTVRADRPVDRVALRGQRIAGLTQSDGDGIAVRVDDVDMTVDNACIGRVRRAAVVRDRVIDGADAFVGNVDRRRRDHRRVVVERVEQFIDFWRRIVELGRRQQVSERNARIQRPRRQAEVAAAALLRGGGVAGGRARLGVDQQCGKVRGRNLDAVDHQLRHEDRAVGNNHRRTVGQRDYQVAANDADVGKLDARREDNDVAILQDGLGALRLQDGRVADGDDQLGRVGGAGFIGQGVGEGVVDAFGRARRAHVSVIALGVDRQRAVLAGDLEHAVGIERDVRSAGAGNGGDTAARVGAGGAADGAGAGDDVAGGGPEIVAREMFGVVPCSHIAADLGSIFVPHKATFALCPGRGGRRCNVPRAISTNGPAG